MKRKAQSGARPRRKATTSRLSKHIAKWSPSSSSRKGASRGHPAPTYFSLLHDAEHALKYQHMGGASHRKIQSHLENKYGTRFDAQSKKLLKSALKRLHNRGRIVRKAGSTIYNLKKRPKITELEFDGYSTRSLTGKNSAPARKRAASSSHSRKRRYNFSVSD